jgi:hypothetical protein
MRDLLIRLKASTGSGMARLSSPWPRRVHAARTQRHL